MVSVKWPGHGKTDKATRDAQQIMADLDAVGNTTKAITKGVAIGSAVIAAVSLFGSFLVDVSRAQATHGYRCWLNQIQAIGIRVDVPQVFVGMLIGGALPWLFSSFAIQAVARAASLIVSGSPPPVQVGRSRRQGQTRLRTGC